MSVEDRLESLIAALRAGDLDAMDGMAELLEAGLADMEADAETLGRLRARAAEAALLLEASAKGVRAARRRVAEIRAVGQGLTGYGPAGRQELAQASVIQRL